MGMFNPKMWIRDRVSAESDIMLKATVKNNGTVDTDEVVQVYIKDLDSPLAVRNYSLCVFKRVSLKDVYKRQLWRTGTIPECSCRNRQIHS